MPCFFSCLLDDVRFVVIGQKLAKHTALQKALKVEYYTVQMYVIVTGFL